LRHRCVRDLAFSLYSETLLLQLDGSPAKPYSLAFNTLARSWLAQLDAEPAPLMAHLAQLRSTRIGRYFEALWSYYWQHHYAGRLLLQDQQLSRAGQTLGALDFVLETECGKLLHIEAAAKFYLAHPPAGGLGDRSAWCSGNLDWIGPNGNERLAYKLGHMRQHQLPMGQTPESRQALMPYVSHTAHPESRFLLRGGLFWPADYQPSNTTTSGDINPRASMGRWWHWRQVLALPNGAPLGACEHYTILPRNHWLAPACYPAALMPLPITTLKRALRRQMAQRQQSLMVVGLIKRQQQWVECERHFVVPDHWPRTARPARNT
jgi:hypothetical protein